MSSLTLPDMDLTSQQTLYLLLDGNLIEDLARQLYSLDSGAQMVGLYSGTPLEHLAPHSPWLIELDISHSNPILEWAWENDYFNSSAWLLSSEKSLYLLTEHFQSLLQVTHPLGHQSLFRFYDPRVAKALMSSHIAGGLSRLTGPIHCSWFYEQGSWTAIQPVKRSDDTSPYTLSNDDVSILNELSSRHYAEQLSLHIQEHFPQWQELSVQEVIQQAQQRGFTTRKSIHFYTNVLGFCYYAGIKTLQENTLSEHPQLQEVHDLITRPGQLTPEQRARQAAKLAWQYHQYLQGVARV